MISLEQNNGASPLRRISSNKDRKEKINKKYNSKIIKIGHYNYNISMEDPSHGFTSNIILDFTSSFVYEGVTLFKEASSGHMAIVKNFIPSGCFSEPLLNIHEDLRELTCLSFLLKVIDYLLHFTASQNASFLILDIEDHQVHELDFLEELISYSEQIITSEGERTLLILSTKIQMYDLLIELRERLEQNFRQFLWQQQRTDSIIRAYLKKYPLIGQ